MDTRGLDTRFVGRHQRRPHEGAGRVDAASEEALSPGKKGVLGQRGGQCYFVVSMLVTVIAPFTRSAVNRTLSPSFRFSNINGFATLNTIVMAGISRF